MSEINLSMLVSPRHITEHWIEMFLQHTFQWTLNGGIPHDGGILSIMLNLRHSVSCFHVLF